MAKTFKEYYEDEAFKAKHKAYMAQHVTCECGCSTVRHNMSKHKKTEKHKSIMQKKESTTITREEYNDLLKKIESIKKL